jgi:alanyl-tRNA synthetase
MTGHELRQLYLNFFREHDSQVMPSSSLIPTDPTTLLTSAGMQPFVPYFKGEETPPSRRLASCQKCCRADDLDNVGVTWRHASFFEMLGNFSFGDYFKREAIVWGWEFLTKTLNIDPKLLWISVYHEDEEAAEFWKKDIGLSDDRIYRFGKKDNWWGPVGKTGPCGPDSEIFFDRGPKYDTGDPELDRPGGDGDRYGELWNLVFQQYNQTEDGTLELLPAPGIDTGMGLERTAAVLQGVDTIHHTDLFAPIINAIAHCGRDGELPVIVEPLALDPADPTTRPLKVIADHVRAATFLAAEGIVPGNAGRDYMLRRFIRRSGGHGACSAHGIGHR